VDFYEYFIISWRRLFRFYQLKNFGRPVPAADNRFHNDLYGERDFWVHSSRLPIADCQLPIGLGRNTNLKSVIGNWQSAIGNPKTHLLSTYSIPKNGIC
jgi:hypothetical protein